MSAQAKIQAAEVVVAEAEKHLAGLKSVKVALAGRENFLDLMADSLVYQAEHAGDENAKNELSQIRNELAETRTLLVTNEQELTQSAEALQAAQAELESAITGKLLAERAAKEREIVLAWIANFDAQAALAQSNEQIARFQTELKPMVAVLRGRIPHYDGDFFLPLGDAARQAEFLKKRLAELDAGQS